MIINYLQSIFEENLQKLTKELNLYPNDSDIWKLHPEINNSAGTLTLHLVGNLQHFIGVVLGDSDYQRDREAEFKQRDIPKSQLLEAIQHTQELVIKTLGALEPPKLAAPYPIPFRGQEVPTEQMLMHLAVHLGFHLGQINYHRRLLQTFNQS